MKFLYTQIVRTYRTLYCSFYCIGILSHKKTKMASAPVKSNGCSKPVPNSNIAVASDKALNLGQ